MKNAFKEVLKQLWANCEVCDWLDGGISNATNEQNFREKLKMSTIKPVNQVLDQ